MHFLALFPPSPLLGRVEKENSLWQLRRKKERQRERLRERREDRWHRSTATATATTSASTASPTTPPPSSRATKRLRPSTEAGGGRSRQKVRRNKGESEARGASPQEGTQWSLTWWRLHHFLCLSPPPLLSFGPPPDQPRCSEKSSQGGSVHQRDHGRTLIHEQGGASTQHGQHQVSVIPSRVRVLRARPPAPHPIYGLPAPGRPVRLRQTPAPAAAAAAPGRGRQPGAAASGRAAAPPAAGALPAALGRLRRQRRRPEQGRLGRHHARGGRRPDAAARGLGGRVRAQQAVIAGRHRPVRWREGQGDPGRGKVLPVQPLRAASGRRLQY